MAGQKLATIFLSGLCDSMKIGNIKQQGDISTRNGSDSTNPENPNGESFNISTGSSTTAIGGSINLFAGIGSTAANNGSVNVKATSGTVAPLLKLFNGPSTNYFGLKSPDNLSSNISFVLPSTAGSTGQALYISSANTLGWTNIVTSVAASAPAQGLTITGGPITTTGTLTFSLANDLAALEGLTGTGLARRTATDTWTLDTSTYLTSITLTGDVTGTGTNSIATTLSNTGVVAGTYNKVTVDAKGRITTATNTPVSPYVQFLTGTLFSGSSNAQIPWDGGAIPTSTQGTAIASRSITPSKTTAQIFFQTSFMVQSNAGNTYQVASLFRGTTCIASTVIYLQTGSRPSQMTINFIDSPNTTSAITYMLRVGSSQSGNTWYINSDSQTRLGGTLAGGSYLLAEI